MIRNTAVLVAVAAVFACAGALMGAPAAIDMIPQTGHGSEVQMVAFSHNGRFAISTSEDMTAKLWHLGTKQLLRTLLGHTGMVTSVVFLRDDARAVTTSFDHTAILWDLATGTIIRRFRGHKHIVWAADVSPDGKLLITSGYDRTIRLWELDTGREIATHDEIDDHRWLRFAPDGRRVLSTSNFFLHLHEIEPWLTRDIERNGEHVAHAAFSADGRQVITAGGDGAVRIWSLNDGTLIRELRSSGRPIWVAFSASGLPLSCDFDGTFNEWDADGKIRNSKKIATDSVRELSDDGRWALSKSSERFTVWDVARPVDGHTYSGFREQIGALAVAGTSIVAMTDEAQVHVWNLLTAAHERTIRTNDRQAIHVGEAMLSVAPAARRFLTGHYAVIKLWDLDTGAVVREMAVDGLTKAVALAPDGKYAVSGGYDMPTIVWNAETGKEVRRLPEQDASVIALAFSPDQRSIALATDDLLVKKFRVRDGVLLSTFKSSRYVVSIAFSPDGKRALFASEGKVHIVDASTWLVERELEGYARPGSVGWRADGQRIVACGGSVMGDGGETVRVWDSKSGDLLWEGVGHHGTVHAAAFSSDGDHVVSGGEDGTLRIWHPATKQSIVMLARDEEWLIYGPDGYFDASRRGGELAAAVRGLDGFRIDQLAVQLNRPDIVLKRVSLGTPELLEHYKARHDRRLKRLGLTEAALGDVSQEAPVATITDLRVEGGNAIIALRLEKKTRPLVRYHLFINGVPLFGGGGKEVPEGKSELAESVELSGGTNRIEVAVVDSAGVESLRDFRRVDQPSRSGRIHFVGFGVSKYKDRSLDLHYAHQDALDLADYFRRAGAAVHTFVDTDATVDAIRRAKALLATAGVDDIVVAFFAGHGMSSSDQAAEFHFLTHEADRRRLQETTASLDLIESLFDGIAARRRVLILDACESGEREEGVESRVLQTATARGLIGRNLVREDAPATATRPRPFVLERERYIYYELARRTGAVVFSSSLGTELSYERHDLANGVFTEELLKALTSAVADRNGDANVSFDELRAYVGPAVATSTRGLQHPTVDRDNPDVVVTLPIATVAPTQKAGGNR